MTGIVPNRSHQSRAHRSTPFHALSSWPLRRKLALALAIPLVLAATLGGVRVAGDLREADNSSASARQVTVLRPAIDYLTASSRAMVAAQGDSRQERREVKAAIADLEAAAEELESTRSSADLTAEQSNQVDVVLDLSRVLREESSTLSPGTWVAQLRQLQTGVTRLITTIANAQLEPQPRLQLIAETLAGRFSLAMQQALALPRGEPRVRALVDGWLRWDDVMPGGCLFVAAGVEFDDSPGPQRDEVARIQREFSETIARIPSSFGRV